MVIMPSGAIVPLLMPHTTLLILAQQAAEPMISESLARWLIGGVSGALVVLAAFLWRRYEKSHDGVVTALTSRVDTIEKKMKKMERTISNLQSDKLALLAKLSKAQTKLEGVHRLCQDSSFKHPDGRIVVATESLMAVIGNPSDTSIGNLFQQYGKQHDDESEEG